MLREFLKNKYDKWISIYRVLKLMQRRQKI